MASSVLHLQMNALCSLICSLLSFLSSSKRLLNSYQKKDKQKTQTVLSYASDILSFLLPLFVPPEPKLSLKLSLELVDPLQPYIEIQERQNQH